MWITMCITIFPMLLRVDNFVEKLITYPQEKNESVENSFIHNFSTWFPQGGVDISSSASVRLDRALLPLKNIFLFFCYFLLIYHYLSSNKMFFTLSTISFVFEFSFISDSILLHACITVV